MAQSRKAAKKTAKLKKPDKVVPEHGRGALYTGGVPGNKGGAGRPRSEFRAVMRGDALVAREEFIKRIEEREPCPECGRKMSDNDVRRWFETAAKFGVGYAKASLDPAVIEELATSVRNRLDADDEQMQQVWVDWGLILGRSVSG